MAVFTVTTAADAVDAGDGVLSLREAVARANATGAADTIRFADALDGRTLTLTRSQLTVTADVAIDGAAGDEDAGVTIDGNEAGRVFLIGGKGTDASLADLTISGGTASSGNGGGVHLAAGNSLVIDRCEVSGNRAAQGGGIYAGADSRLTIRGSSVADNTTADDADGPRHGAGLIAVEGAAVTITGSSFTANRASSYGGGISIESGSSLTISRSQIANNLCVGSYAPDYGGAGLNVENGSATISASAILDNRSGSGAGVRVREGDLVLVQSTIAGNIASTRYGFGQGGGINEFGSGSVSLQNCTVTDNNAGSGSYGSDGGISATGLRIANSIVAGNTAAGFDADYRSISDVGGTIAYSNGHNVFGSDVAGNVAGDAENVAPSRLFAALSDEVGGGVAADNGGPTFTVALRDALGNPALSGAEPATAGAVDQRGVARPLPDGSNPDIGAFELGQTAVSRVATTNNDLLTGIVTADVLAGRAGADLLSGRGGGDRLNGDAGGDTLLGGFGGDVLYGGIGLDTASYRDAGGAVSASLASQTSSGSLGSDRLLRVENLEGGRFGDRLEGDALANALGGGGGGDRLFGLKGTDLLLGGAGADWLNGGRGADGLEGGEGRDLFDYDALADSAPGAANRDLVLGFNGLADRLDLVTLDAKPVTAANDAFTFLAPKGAAFTGAGQVRWFQDDGQTFVEANVDADRGADLQIELAGLRTLTAADFVL